MVTARSGGLPSASFIALNSGRYFPTGSSTDSFPSSCKIITAVAVIGFVIEAIQNSVLGAIGRFVSMSASPTAFWPMILPC